MEEIRECKQEDIPYLINIISEYKKAHNKNIENVRDQIKNTFEDALAANDSKIYVYQNDQQQPVAYINFHVFNFPILYGREIYISELFVLEKMRGRGIGKKLLNQVDLFSRKIACKRIMLLNSKESQAYTKNFYQKNGFEERTGFANFVKSL